MKIKELIPPLLLGIFLIIAWEIVCRIFHIQEFLLPTPWQIILVLKNDFFTLLLNTGITMFEALLGFIIANLIAIILAVLMVYVKNLDKAIMPFAITLKTTPIVAMAPLLLLWFGTGISPKVAASVLICFFPSLVNTIKGFNALEEGEEDLFRVYGATKTQMLLKVRFQRAAPYIFSALRVSSSLAIVGAIVGEFVGANQGIGYVILVASYHLETARMFAALIMTAAAGTLLYGFISYLDMKFIFWMPNQAESIRLESPTQTNKMERNK